MTVAVESAILTDMNERDIVNLTIRLPRHIHEQLVDAARVDMRSINSEAVFALREGLRLIRLEQRRREERERELDQDGETEGRV